MNTFLVDVSIFVAGTVFGVIIAKNLIRWFTVNLYQNPMKAIQDEIDKLKALKDKIAAKL